MKRTLITSALLTVGFLFQFCSDDKDKTPSLSGRFGMVSYESFGCTDATKNKVTTCPSTIHCRDLEFLPESKLTLHYGTVTHNGTYTIVGDQLFLEDHYYSSHYMEQFTMAVSGNTITLTRKDPGSTSNCSEKEIYTKL